jgi:hypothetical protein
VVEVDASRPAFLLHRSSAVLTVDRLALLFGGAAVLVLSGQLPVELVAPRSFAGCLVIATVGGHASAPLLSSLAFSPVAAIS